MKISAEVRDYADELEIQQGMDEMSQKFQELGSEVYVEAEKIEGK
jgi:phosphomethylpyrimidine synthase